MSDQIKSLTEEIFKLVAVEQIQLQLASGKQFNRDEIKELTTRCLMWATVFNEAMTRH